MEGIYDMKGNERRLIISPSKADGISEILMRVIDEGLIAVLRVLRYGEVVVSDKGGDMMVMPLVIRGIVREGYFVGSDGNIYKDWVYGGVKGKRGLQKISHGEVLHLVPAQVKNSGYCIFNIRYGGSKAFNKARAVAESWFGLNKDKETVNHINHIRTDDRPNNIEWLTMLENIRDGVCKRVALYKDGDFVKTCESINEAVIASGISYRSISRILKGEAESVKGWSVRQIDKDYLGKEDYDCEGIE